MTVPAAPDPLAAIASTLAPTLEDDPAFAATAVPEPSPLAVETPSGAPLVPRYERLNRLGEGGMGAVDRARDRDLLRDVAVKQIHLELAGDRRLVDQFLWEARVTAHLDHPNIVPVHDVGSLADGRLFFTMKLVRGRTLGEVIADARTDAKNAPSLPRRLRLFLQVAQAIAFAHGRGVLHRDIKPANVMVGDHGEVLVTDWGLAAPLPSEAGDALRTLMPAGLTVRSAGTPMYMSPEQVRGETLDERSDVYALGATLHELATLAPPFEAASLPVLMERIERGERAPFPESCVAPASLRAVVAKAMAVAPEDRYAKVTDLVADLELVLDGRTPDAEAAPLATRAARFYFAHDPALRRMRVVDIDMWVGGSFLLGIGLGAFAAPWIGARWWVVAAIGGVMSVVTTVRWIRWHRESADDGE